MDPRSGPNEDQAQYWNGPEADHWLVHEHRYERMLAPFTRVVLDTAAVARADRVLDVGCGTGSTTCTAARTAAGGRALGVDISVPLLRRAEQRARQDGLTNVRFERGNVQTHRLVPGGFDVAVSRFGVMFFGDPTVAFANIARGLRPGGRLVFVCWQKLVDNEWITVPGAAVAQPPYDGWPVGSREPAVSASWFRFKCRVGPARLRPVRRQWPVVLSLRRPGRSAKSGGAWWPSG